MGSETGERAHDTEDGRSSHARPFRFKESVDPGNTYKSSSSHTGGHRHHRHRSSRHHSHRKHHRQRDSPGSRSRSKSRERDRSRSPVSNYQRHNRRSRSPGPSSRDLSPDTAFRESLFDAMADDEGAAYWEGVYGQPIHNFGPMPSHSGEDYEGNEYNDPNVLDAHAYAAFVRRKMWERTHQHLIEERAKREADKKRLEEELKKEAEERRKRNQENGKHWYNDRSWRSGNYDGYAYIFDPSDLHAQLDESLKRGQARREDKRWRDAWDKYNKKWTALREARQDEPSHELPWPVLSGEQADVDPDAVRDFFSKALAAVAQKNSTGVGVDLKGVFKAERVRWHPDKIMQRFGESADEKLLKKVTAVFQVVDQLYSQERSKT